MKNLIFFILCFASFLFAQSELKFDPSNVDFKDEFHRIESVKLFNKGDETLIIDSIKYKQSLYFVTLNQPTSFPIQILPEDSIRMDITLTNYFSVTTADTADTISFFTSNLESTENLRVRIRFFDDDENYGTLNGQIKNDSLSVASTRIYLFREGQYLYDSLVTDVNGNFSIQLPEGIYTAAALKENFYFTYYKNKFDIYNAHQFYIENDSTTSIDWKIEKILATNTVLSGNVIDFISNDFVKKGIIIVRKGKHTPTKRSALALNLNRDSTYSTKILDNGQFYFNNIIEPGKYYIQAFPDFYTPSFANDNNVPAILWQDADSILIDNGLLNRDIYVVRDSAYGAGNISGQVFINSLPAYNNDFIVFAKNISNDSFTNYSFVDSLGNYNIVNLPLGNYKLIAFQSGNFFYESEENFKIELTNKSIDSTKIRLTVSSIKFNPKISNSLILFPNYPNPFNPSTIIQFFLPQKENISLNVHNILGEKVSTVYKGELNSGLHSFEFNGNNISSGIYIIRLETDIHNKSMKAILLK